MFDCCCSLLLPGFCELKRLLHRGQQVYVELCTPFHLLSTIDGFPLHFGRQSPELIVDLLVELNEDRGIEEAEDGWASCTARLHGQLIWFESRFLRPRPWRLSFGPLALCSSPAVIYDGFSQDCTTDSRCAALLPDQPPPQPRMARYNQSHLRTHTGSDGGCSHWQPNPNPPLYPHASDSKDCSSQP